jgi:hypothetical protein
MILQCGSLLAIFISLHAVQNKMPNEQFFVMVRNICIWGMLAATLLSGAQYLGKAFQTILSERH